MQLIFFTLEEIKKSSALCPKDSAVLGTKESTVTETDVGRHS